MTIALSISRMADADCLAKFYKLYVSKEVKKVYSDSANEGIEIHEALDKFVSKGEPLPAGYEQYAPALASLRELPNYITEGQYAYDKDWNPVDWFDSTVTFRLKADFLAFSEDGRKALYIDYKTGNRKEDYTQIEVTNFVLFKTNPRLDTIKNAYWWMKFNQLSPITFTRNEHYTLLENKFNAMVNPIEHAARTKDFPYQPSTQACRYCPATMCKRRIKSFK